MIQYSLLTEDELDEQIRQLESRISELNNQHIEVPIENLLENAINTREKEYTRKVKKEYISKVTKASKNLKTKIAFITVCRKYYKYEFVFEMIQCFDECHSSKNWRQVHRLPYKAKMNHPNNAPPIGFLSAFYRRYVIGGYSSNDVMTKKKMQDDYSELFSDFASTNVFPI